jgi:hypothetical protein
MNSILNACMTLVQFLYKRVTNYRTLLSVDYTQLSNNRVYDY